MKVGDKVMCVEKGIFVGKLTLNRIYTILPQHDEDDGRTIRILDNTGEVFGFYTSRFILLPESTVLDAIYGEEE